MSELVIAQKEKLIRIADGIRNLSGSQGTMNIDQLGDQIEQLSCLSGGGSSSAVQAKDVNFYDYDGTLLHAFTLDEAKNMSALPDGPTHDGLVFQGWNWSLDSVKSLKRKMNIGAMYTTDDGKTRIYIHLEDGRTSPMLGVCSNGTVTVDWGDGTEPDTLTGTSTAAVKWTNNHQYAEPGDYVIRLTVDGEMRFSGVSGDTSGSYVLRNSSSSDKRNCTYENAVRKIEIGDSVTSIGTYAFSYCYSLSSISIPDSITSIGTYAFYNCYSLSSVSIPDSVTSIGSYAFYNCYSLSSVSIPDSVTSIGSYTFYTCRSLSSISIPDSVTSIGSYAFSYCSSLSSISIPDSVTSIGTYAFSYCYSLSSISIPDSVTSISSDMFYNCYSLSSISIPDSITSIGTYAFCNCYSLRYVDFSSHISVPTLSNTNAFTGIAEDCEIRVPAALYDEWKAATNWSTYASKIVAV